MTWRVVPMEERHIEGYRAVLDSVARERKYLAFLEAPPVEAVTVFVLGNLRANRPHFVALDGEEVVGWCDIASLDRPVFAHAGTLGMGVLASHRGRGIGRELLRAALENAREMGLTRVELTVREPNARARELYEKAGFAAEGLKRNAVRVDGRYENLLVMAILFHEGR
ncbi:MAG TPA: GNAT family N-acetyltransferase [Burkholderiales bacterium]|nr:GNAT family N-acetyltransferase [Burkholderiales bacterium]